MEKWIERECQGDFQGELLGQGMQEGIFVVVAWREECLILDKLSFMCLV